MTQYRVGYTYVRDDGYPYCCIAIYGDEQALFGPLERFVTDKPLIWTRNYEHLSWVGCYHDKCSADWGQDILKRNES